MNTLDDWPRVKRVLEGAIAREGADRQAYLDEACGGDEALRARVERLLAAGDRVGTFLETPAAVLLDSIDSTSPGDLSDRVVDGYRLASKVGAGGMGEVYLAHDPKLDRTVALKFLSPELAADRTRLRRFHQEARAASSLNHPHIVVVHDFGEMDGRPYIVTEFIEGETLRHRLQAGPLPLAEVVDLGVQIASALAAAHARGLVHRDIKPENIMLRPDGYAKVLDFGLAKAPSAAAAPGEPAADSRTQPGTVIGTPRYMSPEQARGLDLDPRSDVWSLGVVLYEMATGELPFGDAGSGSFDAARDVRASSHARSGRSLPPRFLEVLTRALQTVRDLRYPSGADVCADLKQLQHDPAALHAAGSHRSIAPPPATSRSTRGLVVGAVLAAAIAVLAVMPWMRNRAEPARTGVQKTVAVLPFENVNRDDTIDYLRLALADEVTTALSSIPSIAVRPMASSLRLGGGSVNPQQAGRELRVAGVVTGHFAMRQSELHVTVEAVDVEDLRVLWRGTIAAPAEDSIALRDRLTARIRDGLVPGLGAVAAPAAGARPRHADAYSIYLKTLAASTDPSPNREAIAMLQRVTTLDPEYANAWAALATRYYLDGHYGGGGIQALRRSEAAARQALALNPADITTAVRLLALQVEAGRLQDGYDSALGLIAQRPDSGEARWALSYVLRYGGLLEESARECERAVSRDPTNPLFRTCAQPYIILGPHDRALDFVRLDSGSEWARQITRFIYQRMGRRSDALAQHEQTTPEYLHGLAPQTFYGLLTRCLAGQAPERQLSDEEVRTFLTVREDPEPLYLWASDLAYCGYPGPALRLLRESIRRNFCAVAAIDTDPMFTAIRTSPEYGEILAAARDCRARFSEHVRARGPIP